MQIKTEQAISGTRVLTHLQGDGGSLVVDKGIFLPIAALEQQFSVLEATASSTVPLTLAYG